MQTSTGFPPVAQPDARILILGTLPSVISLARHEYYANPRNGFWWIMGDLVGATPDLAYAARAALLLRRGIALWDVCAAAIRQGSLDADIVPESIVTNDFAEFLAQHRRMELICFNGASAEKKFRRLVAPSLAPPAARIPRALLLSSSGACTRPRAEKLALWRATLQPAMIAA